MNHTTLYDFQAQAGNGSLTDFSTYKGKVLLIVNTASKCGFAPQFGGLETLHKTYRDRGLVVLGFPCDQFAHQEPGSDEEIARICSINFGVTFPLMKKIEVNGPNTHPLYNWLRAKAPGAIGTLIKWNFTKFLVSTDGSRVQRFAPDFEPARLASHIETLLQEVPRPTVDIRSA